MKIGKYLIKAWKTHSAFAKTGRFYQKPLETDSKSEANEVAKDFIEKHKVYAVEISVFDEKLNRYTRIELLGKFPNKK